jgi:oligopeptide transport system substrate-binding protein
MVRHDRGWLYLLLVVVLIGSLGLVAGCAADDEPAEETEETVAPGETTTTEEDGEDRAGQPGGTAVMYIGEPAFIDPVNAQESEGIEVVANIFDGLVAFDPYDSEIEPAVAESWEANEDASVWTFNLRQGVMFHNGQEVTAQDFKYAWERIADPENESEIAYHLSAIQGFDEMQEGTATELSGVVAIDDYTLEVTLSYAFGDFPYVTGHPSLGPVPQEAVEGENFAEMPIGNGPFMMAEPWAHDQYIRVVRFDDYYGETALLDGVEFRIFTDEETAFLEFRAGNVDFTRIPTGQIESTKAEYGESEDGLEPSPGAQALLGPEVAIYYIGLNSAIPPMDNVDLRRALSLAVNREAIIDTVYEGTRSVATGIVPEGVAGFQDDAWEYSRYDPEEAAELLEQAGYPNGDGLEELVLGFNSGAGHEDVMQLVQSDFAAIGVNVRFDSLEFAQYLDRLDEDAYPIFRLGWLADYPIKDNFLYPLLTSDSADNHSNYANPEFDRLVREARTTADEDERLSLYQDAERLAGQDAPVIPLNFYRHRHVASDRLNGFVYDPMGLGHWDLAWIEE